MTEEKIITAHGSGGAATKKLIEEIFAGAYGNGYLSQMEDATVVPGGGIMAMTTDSFVVRPLEFPGGDIGRLAVCGTVNDLAARGAKPAYLTAGFILEEGLEIPLLKRVINSMAETAKEAGVVIVAGDTKVVEGNGGMYINTAGVGFYKAENEKKNCDFEKGEDDFSGNPDNITKTVIPGTKMIRPGDAIILSGTIGDHHAAIMSARLDIEGELKSDVAPLCEMTGRLMDDPETEVHAMRDVTRGGLATVLAEMAEGSGLTFEIEEKKLPLKKSVASFAGLLGLDPLYMGNEGKMAVILPKNQAEKAMAIIKNSPYGENAAIIGQVYPAENEALGGRLILKTGIGGRRLLGIMTGEGLPRIC